MKVENNNLEIKELNWKYFPNVFQLSQYLLQSDLIQLSLTCSQFRNKLKSVIFRKLELLKGGKVIPGRPNTSSKKKQLDVLFNILEEDYLGSYHFIKHCILWEPCNSAFSTKLFSTFAHVNKLELYTSSDSISRSTLVRILDPLKNLEVLVFDYRLIDSFDAESVPNFKLPTCLKVVDVLGYSDNSLNFSPIEIINGEYTELKKVTMINNNMLANISASISSLTEVTIFNNQYFYPKLLIQLFSSNPQLKKISISLKLIESGVINSILSLKKLNKLDIMDPSEENTNELNNLAVSASIKHLCISRNITQNILLPILTSIKSLHTLELYSYDFWHFNTIDWSLYNEKIALFVLNGVYFTGHNLDMLFDSPIFGKIKFINSFELDFFIEQFGFNDLENWKVIQGNPLDKTEFFLVKKNQEE
jgi:hypothetical protein